MTPTALVTGGSSGIGRAIAEALLRLEWTVVLVGRSVERLESTRTALVDGGASAESIEVLSADVGAPGAAERIVEETRARCGGIDALVNSAGITDVVMIPETTEAELERTFAVNALGPALLIARAWPHLAARASATGRATIVNISSMASLDPFTGFFAYAASKSALDSFTRSAAQEGEPIGIRPFSVNPGAVETPMLRSIFDEDAIPASATLAPERIATVAVECILGARDEETGRSIPVPSG